jgi:WD40 repeat protein
VQAPTGFSSLALSADGKRAITASGTALIENGKTVVKDGQLVYEDCLVRVWDVETGQELRRIDAFTHPIRHLALSADGRRAVLVGYSVIRLWDVDAGREIRQLDPLLDSRVVFCPDGRHVLASDSSARAVKLWDVETNREVRRFPHPHFCYCLAVSPDGRYFVSGSGRMTSNDGQTVYSNCTVNLWDIAKGQELGRFEGHTRTVVSVAFSPDSRRALSGGDNTMRLWELMPKVGPTAEPKAEPVAAAGQPPLTIRERLRDVWDAAFSPDGKHIVGASQDKTVKFWNAQTGEPERALAGHTAALLRVAFSPDGKYLASASADKTVKVWDAQTGQERFSLEGHTSHVRCVAFSPDGKRIVSGGGLEGSVKLWDAETGQEQRTLQGHRNEVYGVAFSPDGQRLVSGSGDMTVKVWNAQTGQVERTLRVTSSVNRVAFSPDGQRIIGGTGKTVKVWNAQTGQELFSLQGHADYISCVAFSPDGKRIASSSQDQTVKLWDAQTGREERTFQGHTSPVNSVAFSPDGKRLVSAGFDKTVKVWTLPEPVAASPAPEPEPTVQPPQPGNAVRLLLGHTDRVHSISFSRDGKRALSCSADGTVRVWDVQTGKELFDVLKAKRPDVQVATWTSDGRYAVVGTARAGQAIHYDVEARKFLSSTSSLTSGEGAAATALAFLPDNERVLFANSLGDVRLYRSPAFGTLSDTKFPRDPARRAVYSVGVSADGRFGILGCSDGLVQIYDLATLRETRRLIGHKADVLGVGLSKDGSRALTAADQTVRVWQAQTGKTLYTCKGHTGKVTCLALATDGRRAVSGSEDKTLRVWDVQTGKERKRLTGHTDTVTSVALSSDGRYALSASADHSIRLWDLSK